MRYRRSSVAAAAAALVLLLPACGAGESAGDDPPGGASPPGAPADPGPASGTPEAGDEGTQAPETVPESLDFTGTTVAGAPFDAAQLAGEPVVLWFWAPWCPRCRAQAPAMRELADQVTVVGVGGLAAAGDMQEFIDRTETGTLTHLSDPEGAIWSRFGVAAQETLVLIGADGEVLLNGIVSVDQVRAHLD